jgi:predicted amidohydrolase
MLVRVAAVQFATGADVEANLATVLRMLQQARGAEVIVLPEFCNHPSWYDDADHAWDVSIDVDGDFVKAVGQAAADLGAWVMLNATVRREPGRITDTNLLLDATGALVATSDKQVLMGGERLHISEGTEHSPIIDTPFGAVGLYSCMDGVIFETPRMLAVRGAHLLLNSLNSFALDEASLHIPVRAAENKVWVVAANKVGPLLPEAVRDNVAAQLGIDGGWLEGAGESQIVAPDGTVVAIAPRHGEAVVTADIDVALAHDKRRPDGTDIMAARRPATYAPLAAEPRGVTEQPGPAEALAAVVTRVEDVAAAVASGARLVVLPELAQTPDGTTTDPARLADEADAFLAALAQAAGDAVAVTTVVRREGAAFAHTAVAVGGGVAHEQRALHASGRHPWATELAGEVSVVATPVGRLALLVGDDGLYPEAVRLTALVEAEVVALPFTALEAWELRTGLVERAAENRVNLVAASRVTDAGQGVVLAAQKDFTLWTPWERAFDGTINYPVVTAAPRDGSPLVSPVHPAATANRFVSRGTDVVDGRPWRLLSALVEPR